MKSSSHLESSFLLSPSIRLAVILAVSRASYSEFFIFLTPVCISAFRTCTFLALLSRFPVALFSILISGFLPALLRLHNRNGNSSLTQVQGFWSQSKCPKSLCWYPGAFFKSLHFHLGSSWIGVRNFFVEPDFNFI